MNEILADCFNDTIDGSHPNSDGMNTLATLVIKETAPNEAKGFMNC